MNQILNSDPNISNNIRSKNFNEIPQRNNRNKNTDKIIRIFAICMIVFAAGLISSGVYSYYFNNQDYEETVIEKPEATAEISAEEIDGRVVISVTDRKDISQLVYSWNGQKETKVQGEGKSLEKTIDLPAGKNNLLVSVTNIDGVETTFEQVFESENGVDIINPVISLDVEGAKLVVNVTDETALEFITYRWNDEEETKVTPESDKTEIKKELEIKRGENDITVVAVDTNNNTTTITKQFKGVTKPEIVIELSSDLSSLDITCTHDVGIKKVEYTLNDRKYEGSFDDSPTSVQFEQALDVGYNRIILTVTSVENTTCTFDGQTDYYPEGDKTSSNSNTNETENQNTVSAD